MEQNLPIVAKKFWNTIRVLFFMLRKSISKAKLLADLNTMMKRGKIAGKAAIRNLIFHHAAAISAAARRSQNISFAVPMNEYEFSCSNSPAFQFPGFHLNKKKHAEAPPVDGEMLAAEMEMVYYSAAASPAWPGFGPSPVVRQLRITDSPFPLRDVDEDHQVDEAAEKFIMKFYNDLKMQNSTPKWGFS